MTTNKYHFFSLRTATAYHLARRLDALGWARVNNESDADFSGRNLALNEAVSQQLEYKHLLAQLVSKHKLHIMPLTYCLDDDNAADIFAQIIYEHYLSSEQILDKQASLKWILKPSMLNNAENIALFESIDAVKQHYYHTNRLGGPHVLQKYITNPALINGRKFTFRIHVFVTNFGGIYLYHRGYMNISAVPFDLHQGFAEKKMHITNYMLDGVQSFITQQTTDQMPGFEDIYPQMKKSLTAVFKALIHDAPDYCAPDKPQRFEIFGCDFLLDDAQKLWLLEINQGPDAPMYEDNPLKPLLWEPFWQDVIDQFVLPIAHQTAGPIQHPHFERLFSKSQAYSPWRGIMKRLIS